MLEDSKAMEKYIPIGEKLGLSEKELLSFVMERFQDEKEAKEKADLIEREKRAARRAAEREREKRNKDCWSWRR